MNSIISNLNVFTQFANTIKLTKSHKSSDSKVLTSNRLTKRSKLKVIIMYSKLIIGYLRRKVLYEELKPEPDLQIEIRYSNRVKRICPQMSFRKFRFIRKLTIDDMLSARLQNIISNV